MFTVVLDACVLVPITLTDLILRAAQQGLFDVRWSERILDETKRTMVRLGVPQQAADRRIAHMQRAFPFATVEFSPALEAVMTNDVKDRHVAAAALTAQVQTIVTFNLKDFGPEHLAPLSLAAIHPDEFLLSQLDLAPGTLVRALQTQANASRRPVRSIEEILGRIGRSGLPQFADEALRHLP